MSSDGIYVREGGRGLTDWGAFRSTRSSTVKVSLVFGSVPFSLIYVSINRFS